MGKGIIFNEKNKIEVINGFAKLIDRNTIQINGNNTEKVTAEHIVILQVHLQIIFQVWSQIVKI